MEVTLWWLGLGFSSALLSIGEMAHDATMGSRSRNGYFEGMRNSGS
jgi:hypothetical protein